MRTASRFFAFASFAVSLFCVPTIFTQTTFAQTNPPPPDPHEIVTRDPKTLTKSAERSAALDLLGRARQNFNLQDIPTPYALKVSFDTNGASQMEGQWTMEDYSDGASHWRWTAQLGDIADHSYRQRRPRLWLRSHRTGSLARTVGPFRFAASGRGEPGRVYHARRQCRTRRQGYVLPAAQLFAAAQPRSALLGRERRLHRSRYRPLADVV